MIDRVSFSIWAKRLSVSVKDRDAYTTSFHSSPCSCNKTAPNPYDDASEESFVLHSGSYSASTVGFKSLAFVDRRIFPGLDPKSMPSLSSSGPALVG